MANKDTDRFNAIRKVNSSSAKKEVLLYKKKTGSRKIIIEKGVPMPKVSHGIYTTRWGRVIEVMEHGDSVIVNDKNEAGVMRAAARTRGRGTVQQKLEESLYRVWVVD